MDINQSIAQLKGIGAKTELLYKKLGIFTIGDLLEYYPRSYDMIEKPVSFGNVREGETCAVTGCIRSKPTLGGNPRLQILTLPLSDETGKLKLIWFRMSFLRQQLVPGTRFIFRGKISFKKGSYVMEQPKIYTPAQYEALQNTLQPVYALTQGITSHHIAKMIQQSLEQMKEDQDWLLLSIREKFGLIDYQTALRGIHFPEDKEQLILCRRRLVFDEFLIFLMQVQAMKETNEKINNRFQFSEQSSVQCLLTGLPYELTSAQKRTWVQIKEDMMSKGTMNRLVQGDVGSGKTILAVLALVLSAENGYQGALMAPTEVLARQHYESITRLFEEQKLPFTCALLIGSMTVKEKRHAYEQIRTHQAAIVIGTHALIQERVEYDRLALVVTDEQHRFGVRQREALYAKGQSPHVLVMSATPIPRTLAIMLYGDMDLSVMDELPANRLPIKNCVVGTSYRKTAYHFMQQEIEKGHQVYVICPMVEASEMLEAENVIDYSEEMRDYFPTQTKITCLHGKMKASEKNEIMEQFAANQIQILVSTTVIEVGINVPNATVMMIENAERFGLAQLHQLRGRVGRGKAQSYCIFINGNQDSRNKERLEILNQSNDGFYVAAEDLKLRGPGDFFGIRQSGILSFKLGDIYQDAAVLSQASEAVKMIYGTNMGEEILNRKETILTI